MTRNCYNECIGSENEARKKEKNHAKGNTAGLGTGTVKDIM
jgi:hypothetical protein